MSAAFRHRKNRKCKVSITRAVNALLGGEKYLTWQKCESIALCLLRNNRTDIWKMKTNDWKCLLLAVIGNNCASLPLFWNLAWPMWHLLTCLAVYMMSVYFGNYYSPFFCTMVIITSVSWVVLTGTSSKQFCKRKSASWLVPGRAIRKIFWCGSNWLVSL